MAYQKTLTSTRGRGDKRQEDEAYFGLGHTNRENGEYQKAIEYYQKAQRIAQERGDKFARRRSAPLVRNNL